MHLNAIAWFGLVPCWPSPEYIISRGLKQAVALVSKIVMLSLAKLHLQSKILAEPSNTK